MTATTTLTTPVGDLAVVIDDDGAVVASGFAAPDEGPDALTARLVARLRLGGAPPEAEPSLASPIADAVGRYFAGDLPAIDEVPVRQTGAPFATAVWEALRAVPPGEPVTYAELARRAGSPRAARAAGQVCARNLVAPFVPCHRVVPAGGGVGGYAYGADLKTRLLDHESVASGRESSRDAG